MLPSCKAICLLSASAIVLSLSTAARAQTEPTPLDSADAGADAEELVVTGSRLSGSGFNAPTPVTVVGSETLQNLGATSLYNVTKDIPAFRNSAGPDNSNSGVRAAGQAILDLRGLGASRTLTLIDGMRPTPVNANGTYDSGLVPVSLVERLEVVTGGASAAYGSDAVAGVVNIRLKHRLEGLTGTLQYGQTERGDGEEVMASLGWGQSFAGGRGQFVVGGDFVNAWGVGTIYSRDWGRKEPGLLGLPANRPAGLPANILSNNVQLISYNPGGLVTSGPLRGTTFLPDGTPAMFEYGSLTGTSTQIGTSNPGMTAFGTTPLRVPFKRYTAMARAEYEFSSSLTGFAMVNYGYLESGGDASRQPNPGAYIVLPDNPYLPAATRDAMLAAGLSRITVNRINTEYDPSGSDNHFKTYQGVVGLKGSLSDRWSWDASFLAGRTEDTFRFVNIPNQANLYASAYVVQGPNGPVCGPVDSNPYFAAQNALTRAQLIANLDPGCVPSNIFGAGSISQEAIDYFLRQSEVLSDIRHYNFSANVNGTPFDLPGGPLSLAIGVEWRRDSVNAVACDLCIRNALTATNMASYSGTQIVKEIYGEVGAPILRDLPLITSLDLNAAIRRTDYSLSGAVTTWKLGATWDVTDFLRLRVTRSRDIRAPNINELFNAGSFGVGNVTNPLTGGTGIVASRTVGNPDLVPEVSRTWVIGGALTPSGLIDGLRLSVDYFDIRVNGVIDTLGAQQILNGFFLEGIERYGQFIVQNDSPIGIASVSSTVSNLGMLRAKGFDFELLYSVPIDAMDIPGQFQIRALGTHTQELSTTADGVTLETAGYAAGVPRWVWNVNLNYDLGKFGAGLQAKYASDVRYSNQRIGPDDPAYDPALPNSINRNKWPASVYLTLNARYNLIDDARGRLQVYGVVNNLLDKDPPLVAGVLFTGGSPYDTIGRSFKIGVRFEH